MQHPRLLPLLLSLLVLAACGEGQPPTAPTPPAGPGGPAFSHTPGHKVVNSLADPGDGTCNATQCTLREAISDPASTEISFASGLTGPITLAPPAAGGGTLRIEKTLTISGPGTGIVIRRRSTDPAFRILRIGEGVTVTLANLAIRGGTTDGAGGGIVNRGTLELTNCIMSDNSAAEGAGIGNFARLTLRHSTVARNTGTGIFNFTDGTVTLKQSEVAHNGFGIRNAGGDLALTRSTVAENSGGGIGSDRGRVTLTEARIVANTGTGISGDHTTVTLTNSTVARNSSAGDGGGINNYAGGFRIAGSTVANNSAVGRGGGIFNSVQDPFGRQGAGVALTNSTVSGNSADSGGGIFTTSRLGNASVTLTNSTVALNSARKAGGGIRQEDSEDEANLLVLTNSLVARNTAPSGPDVLAGQSNQGFVFASFNLIGDGTGSPITNTDGNQVGKVPPNSGPIDPLIGPLELNGGPTRTHALLLGSPAIDAASTPDCPPTDQRGVLRPQGAACDIGSYERE